MLPRESSRTTIVAVDEGGDAIARDDAGAEQLAEGAQELRVGDGVLGFDLILDAARAEGRAAGEQGDREQD